MATNNSLLLFTILSLLIANGVRGEDLQPQTQLSIASVNDVVEKPADHLGKVRLVGVVAAVSQGKGFVLVDKREYDDCGLSCVAEPSTKRMPIRWSGDAPKLEQAVRVAGTLSQSEQGLSFVAQEIRIQ